MPRNRFTNPANGQFYDWIVNHTEEDESVKARVITATGTTDGVNRVWTQGPEGPFTMTWNGKIDHRSQLQEMWRWFALSRTQTIYLRDYDGQEYEVQMTEFAPKRERKLSYTGRDPSVPHHYWSYRIRFQVYRFRSGDMAVAGVTP